MSKADRRYRAEKGEPFNANAMLKGFWIGSFALSLLLAGLVAALMVQQPPRYQAEAKLMIEPLRQNPHANVMQADLKGPHERVERHLDQQITLLKSLDLWKVAQDKITQDKAATSVPIKDGQNAQLEVTRIDKSRILSLRYQSTDPQAAAGVLNALTQSYLALRQQQVKDKAKLGTQRLLGEISNLQQKIEAKQATWKAKSATADDAERQAQEHADLTSNKKLLDQLLLRYREAEILQGEDMIPPAARLVSRATVPLQPMAQPIGLYAAMTFCFSFLLLGLGRLISQRVFARRVGQQETGFIEDHMPVRAHMITEPERMSEPQTAPQKKPQSSTRAIEPLPSLAWEIAQKSVQRVLFLSPDPQNSSDDIRHLAALLSEWGRSVIVISIDKDEGADADNRRPVGLTDLIDSCANYGDIIEQDPALYCHRVGCGTRDLLERDFADRRLHTFLTALESAYDFVLLDVGRHFDHGHAMECLAATAQAHLVILANEEVGTYDEEISAYFKTLGFAEVTLQPEGHCEPSAILPSACYATQAAE